LLNRSCDFLSLHLWPVNRKSFCPNEEINTSAYACLDRFCQQVNQRKELAGKANGVLVLPGVIEAGFIVDGEYGEGALRIGGKTVSYYNIAPGSLRFQIDGAAKDFIIMSMMEKIG